MLTILGCGNLNRSDDGAGVVVAQRLLAAGRYDPARVNIFDAGTDGMGVLYRARGTTSLIIVDACSSGSEPGTLFEVPGPELESTPKSSMNLHEFRWDHALFVGRKLYGEDFPNDVTVFLIEAQSLELGCELTPVVQRTVGELVARLAALIEARP